MMQKTDSFLAIISTQCHPHHQINQFLRFHYKSLLKYKRYSWPRHVARPKTQTFPEDHHYVQTALDVHHPSDSLVLFRVDEKSVENHW